MGHNYFSQLDVFITLTDLTPMFQSCVIKTLHMTVLFEHQRNIVSVLWAIFVIKGLQFLQILGMDGIDLFLGRSVNFLQLDWFANYNWTFYFINNRLQLKRMIALPTTVTGFLHGKIQTS